MVTPLINIELSQNQQNKDYYILVFIAINNLGNNNFGNQNGSSAMKMPSNSRSKL